MEDNIFNQMKQELENRANEKVKQISVQEILKYAKKERTLNICMCLFSAIFSLFTAIILFVYGCSDSEIYNMSLSFGIIFCVLFVFFIIYMIFDIRKTDKELAIRAIKRELKPNIQNKFMLEAQKKELPNSEFVISKTISILASGWTSTKLLIDNEHKWFVYQKGKTYSKVFSFTDLITYEVYENGQNKVKGRAGSALIGGAFFGLGGLIVGSSLGRKIEEKCNALKLIINVNDIDCPQITITYVDNVNWDKSGYTYRTMKENLQQVCSILEYIMNNKNLEQNLQNNKYDIEQLQELKEMFEEGLISQSEYEAKKKKC